MCDDSIKVSQLIVHQQLTNDQYGNNIINNSNP